MPEDIRRVAFEFSKLQSDMNKNELSFRQLRQSMSTKDFENYKRLLLVYVVQCRRLKKKLEIQEQYQVKRFMT